MAVSGGGWVGVDLDGTLAEYTEWLGPRHIGAPVPAMLERVRRWLAAGRDVRIFTARVSVAGDEAVIAREAIVAWCLEHLGAELPITCRKDLAMVELWDDRCVQVEPNTGRRVDDEKRVAGADEIGWLVESVDGLPRWLLTWNEHRAIWTHDASRAMRFARKVDATTLIGELRLSGCRATEHAWISSTRSTASPAPTTEETTGP